MRIAMVSLFLISILALEMGCGVKSKPLAPLKEPWISTGDLEKDREKKNKLKRPPAPAENRVEFTPKPPTEDKKER